MKDPETPLRTAMLLAEIPSIKQYGRSYGLTIHRNYHSYSSLGRPAAVWFTGAADPVAFKPIKYCFPIVGCFPGLGWFDEDDAVRFKLSLDAKGYDATVRPAAAFSTGGWFPDPVLSTMLGSGDDALPGLANVILHESVHATVLVPDEPFFNESFASYVADALTNNWITQRFGPGSPEDLAWKLGEALRLPRTARTLATYQALKVVYESKVTRDQKLTAKAKIIDELVVDLKLRKRPNNASLTESRVYNGGAAPILIAEDLTPIAKLLGDRCRERARKAS